jgi:hypothetical protein
VDVEKTSCRWSEVSQWSDDMAEDFAALAGLASACPGAVILLHTWPNEMSQDQFCRCFGAWMRQIMDGFENLEP